MCFCSGGFYPGDFGGIADCSSMGSASALTTGGLPSAGSGQTGQADFRLGCKRPTCGPAKRGEVQAGFPCHSPRSMTSTTAPIPPSPSSSRTRFFPPTVFPTSNFGWGMNFLLLSVSRRHNSPQISFGSNASRWAARANGLFNYWSDSESRRWSRDRRRTQNSPSARESSAFCRCS